MSKAEELAEALRTGDRSGIWYSGMEAAAELRRLSSELADCKAGEQRGIAKAAEEFSGKIAQLEAQLLEARKDAERYRRLRAKLVDRSSSGLSHWVCSINAMDELDAAIDAAISKEREK